MNGASELGVEFLCAGMAGRELAERMAGAERTGNRSRGAKIAVEKVSAWCLTDARFGGRLTFEITSDAA